MLGFAVDNRSSGFARVFADAFPDAHHVAAGRIDDLAAAVFNLLLDRQFGSKRRHDDDVVGAEIGDVRLLVLSRQVLDT